MTEKKVKVKYIGPYTGTIVWLGGHTFKPGDIYECKADVAKKLLSTGQFVVARQKSKKTSTKAEGGE